ncbi:hypothetical protein [Flavobacterium phycosphaerae]|uniref:hypothetical protein n=1 Tax=Flavobacterium phycosphaerae TaxID=2697515 RepID=UPI00138A662A|nr:hypothetical protein [Flavobacterium phycosphaerae]
MKTIFYSTALLLSFVGFSQNPISFGNNKIPKSKYQSGFLNVNVSPLSFKPNYLSQKNFASGYALEVYNPTTQLNDTFVKVNDTYYMSNIKSFPNYGFDGIKMDSFNPYGTSDIGGTIVSGLINLLLSGPKDGF